MISQLFALLRAGVSSLCDKRELALENLALRQQLAVYNRNAKRPKLTDADRVFWMALIRWWPKWREALIIVKPETVISWHRKGFRLFWKWKSRHHAHRRTTEHLDAFRRLTDQLSCSRPNRSLLLNLEQRHNIFPEMDYRC
ncbi:MAG TPA: 1,4-alpha-glucan branching protein domain-containing protein, partial [Myxococcota bacterium]|nr:1,4-alpha-glucan branching protein domain-containing protein [Myxococcota bacterium]